MEYKFKKACEAIAFMSGKTYRFPHGSDVQILVINRNNNTALGKYDNCLIAFFYPQVIIAEDKNGLECELLDYHQAIYLLNQESYYFDYLDQYAAKDMSDIDCAYILKKQNFRIIITIYELIVALWKSQDI